jgi:hypothetical protein
MVVIKASNNRNRLAKMIRVVEMINVVAMTSKDVMGSTMAIVMINVALHPKGVVAFDVGVLVLHGKMRFFVEFVRRNAILQTNVAGAKVIKMIDDA